MNRDELLDRLLTLPALLTECEALLLTAERHHRQAVEAKKDREAALLVDGLIDGKNCEVREAKLRIETAKEREAVLITEMTLDCERMVVRCHQYELSALKAAARLMAGRE